MGEISSKYHGDGEAHDRDQGVNDDHLRECRTVGWRPHPPQTSGDSKWRVLDETEPRCVLDAYWKAAVVLRFIRARASRNEVDQLRRPTKLGPCHGLPAATHRGRQLPDRRAEEVAKLDQFGDGVDRHAEGDWDAKEQLQSDPQWLRLAHKKRHTLHGGGPSGIHVAPKDEARHDQGDQGCETYRGQPFHERLIMRGNEVIGPV